MISYGNLKTNMMKIFQSKKTKILLTLDQVEHVALTTNLWTKQKSIHGDHLPFLSWPIGNWGTTKIVLSLADKGHQEA